MENPRTKRIFFTTFCIFLTALVWGMGGWILYKLEYFSQFAYIDNIVATVPMALAVIFCVSGTVLVWHKHTKPTASLSVILAAVMALSAVLFPRAVRGDWWIAHDTSNLPKPYPDISVYAPFCNNEKVARLEEASSLGLQEEFPVLDGSLALYPLYSAFAEAVYAPNGQAKASVVFTDTIEAFEGLIDGERDIIFSAYASENQLKSAKDAGADLVFTPIGKEAFVFLTGKNNPVDSLTVQQIKNVYSGKTATWRTLGWAEGGNIIAFQRPEGSGSQTGLQRIMGNLPIQAPQPLPDRSLIGTNSLMQQISVEWKGVQPALGYSYRYYATSMLPNPQSKLLKINGVAPTVDNIKDGSYPFTVQFYAVTNGNPTGNTKALIDWILSPQGQELIEKTGYTPIN